MATISINNLAHAIYESSKDKEGAELTHLIENTTNFLSEKHMLGKAPQILNSLEKIVDKESGVVRAKVSSKEKLDKKMSDEIENIVKEKYKARDTEITYFENKDLLGGIKIEVGDEVINMTLRSKLDKLQDYLIKN